MTDFREKNIQGIILKREKMSRASNKIRECKDIL